MVVTATSTPAGNTGVVATATATPVPAGNQPVATNTAVPSGNSPSGGAQTGPAVIDILSDGRTVFTARSTVVDPKLGFEPYKDTSVTGSARYDFTLPNGYSAVVGGVRVQPVGGNEYAHLMAFQGPGRVNVDVTNGFYSVVASDRGEEEWCVRLAEARVKGWLSSLLKPLSGWNRCR